MADDRGDRRGFRGPTASDLQARLQRNTRLRFGRGGDESASELLMSRVQSPYAVNREGGVKSRGHRNRDGRCGR